MVTHRDYQNETAIFKVRLMCSFRFPVLLLAPLLFLSACVTGQKVTEGKYLSREWGGISPCFKQEGKTVENSDVLEMLESRPDTRETLRGYQTLEAASLASAVIGGGLIGYAIAKDGADSGLLYGGAGALILSGITGRAAMKKIENAVDQYNESLLPSQTTERKSASADFSPWVALKGGSGVAGVKLTF